MNEYIRRGSRGQLVGLNLWVVCLFLGYLAFTMFNESPIGFILIFIIVVLFIVGFIRMYAGSYYLLKGSFYRRGRWLVLISLILIVTSPIMFFLGFFTLSPLNYIFLQLGLWSFLSSFIIPYMRRGGRIIGTLALMSSTALGVFVLGYVLFGTTTLPWFIPVSLGGIYFFLLEISMFRCYVGALNEKEFEQMPEYEVQHDALAIRKTTVPGPVRMKMSSERRIRTSVYEGKRNEPPKQREMADPEPSRGKNVTSFEEFVKEMETTRKEPPSRRARMPPPTRKRADPPPLEEPDMDVELDMEGILVDGDDLYSILRVNRDASITELRRAYRKRALLFHPDRNRGVGELYTESINEEMRKLNKAKEILFDIKKRLEYDRRLKDP